MSLTLIQSTSGFEDASDTSFSLSLTGVTAGNVIVFGVKHEGAATTITVSDGTSSFTALTKTTHGLSNDLHVQIFYLLSANAGTVTYTVTFAAARPFKTAAVWEVHHNDPVEVSGEAGASGTWTGGGQIASSGNFTADGAADHFSVGAYGEYSIQAETARRINDVAADASLGAGNGWYWHRITTAGFTGDADLTSASSGDWVVRGASFKEVAAAGGIAAGGLALLGVGK